jgi:hypothetical protein
MVANKSEQTTDLIDAAVSWMNGVLPSGWSAERAQRQIPGPDGLQSGRTDAVINVRAPNSSGMFAVEARSSVTPRDAEFLMAGLSRTLRSFANVPVLVVAPWLSARTRELLAAEQINYLDLTGNAWIRMDYPAVFLSAEGAARNPEPAKRNDAGLRGAKAGRLIRELVDVRPPYGVTELAEATQLNPGYVSRLLEALDRGALVDRAGRGQVVAVDYPALLRRWVESYDVLKANQVRRYIAPVGASTALESLGAATGIGRTAVTGSFAAVRKAPVAAPALLLVYVEEAGAVAGALDLLPADAGANVMLLAPFDAAAWERREVDGGIAYVAPSQAVADCLTGTGRMPAEGEALLTWMTENEDKWRQPRLDQPRTDGDST